MIVLPALLYKSPGQYKANEGATYQYIGVSTQAEYDDKISTGWSATSAEAIALAGDNAYPTVKAKPKWAQQLAAKKAKRRKPSKPFGGMKRAAEPEDDAPPTRAEMATKATELGLKFDGRTSDRKLAQMIQDAIKG